MQLLFVFAIVWLISEFLFLALCDCNPYALDTHYGLLHVFVEAVSTCCYETTVFLTLGMNKKWYYLLCGYCDKGMKKFNEKNVLKLTIQNDLAQIQQVSPLPTPVTPEVSNMDTI